jgi:ferredoxin-type protein NapH
MLNFLNLSLLRKLVQLGAFLFLVYGSAIVGFYTTEKLSNALPALSCAYDMQTADYCTLIPFQHQMDHRLGMALTAGGDVLKALLPTLITFGTFLLMFVVLNKAFCGWICPLGFFQEVLSLIGQKLGLQRIESLPEKLVQRLRPLKWVILLLLVFGFPLLAGLGLVGHELGSPYCSICPSRILTSVATGDSSQVYVDTSSSGYFILSLIANLLFGLMVAWGLFVRQPFCRICPMLALHATFRKLGLVRLVKNSTPRCEKCGICARACPMDIREIHTEMEKKDVLFADCTLCGRCVEFCPDKDVLKLSYTVVPLLRADPAYFKKRKKAQGRWENSTLLAWWRGRRGAGL